MTTPRDPDAIIAAWLEDGPNRLPEATRRAIAVSTRTSQQKRHPMWTPWRTPMHPFTRLAAAAIAVVAALGGAVYLLAPGNQNGGVGAPPSDVPSSAQASASTGPTPSASATPIDTATWTTYVSDRYGFSIGHPADWTERPADHDWTLASAADWLSTASEGFIAPATTILATAWSVPVAPGTSIETWLQAYCPKNTLPCTGQDRAVVIMDGHPGILVPFKDDTQAFTLVGDRMYVVAVWEPDSDPRTLPYGGARRLLEAYVATLHLLPGGPVPASSAPPPAPSPPPS